MPGGSWDGGVYVHALTERDRRGRPKRLLFWAIRPGRDSWLIPEPALSKVAQRRGLGLKEAAAALATERQRPGWDVPELHLAPGGPFVPVGAGRTS